MNLKRIILILALLANIAFAQSPDVFVTSELYQDVFTTVDNTETIFNWVLLLYTIFSFLLFVLSFYIFWRTRYYLLALFGLYRPHEVRIKEFTNKNTESATEQKEHYQEQTNTNTSSNAQEKDSKNTSKEKQEYYDTKINVQQMGPHKTSKEIADSYSKPRVVIDYEGQEPVLKIVS